MWETYRGRGVRFLGVDFRDDRAAARAFVDEFDITYPSVFDPSGAWPTTSESWPPHHVRGG